MASDTKKSELYSLVKEDYDRDLNGEELTNFANSLVDYFKLLKKIKERDKNKYEYRESKN